MPRHMIYPKSRLVRKLTKAVKDDSGKTLRSEPDGEEEIYYSTEISIEGLDALARQAARNQSGQSVDGPLRVKILSRRRL